MPTGPEEGTGFWRGAQNLLLDVLEGLVRRIMIAAGIGAVVAVYGIAAMGLDIATAFGIFAITTVIVLIIWLSLHSFFV